MDKEKIKQDWKDEALKAIQSGRVLTADEEMEIILKSAGEQLAAANKAIVALSEALESNKLYFDICEINPQYNHCEIILTEHAPAIEKARGG